MNEKASNTKLLVQFEQRLEYIKNIQRKKVMEEYLDMVDWFMLLNKNPR